MKHFFLLAFMLITLGGIAQTQVKDSTWQTNIGGIFYENRYIEYDNGNYKWNREKVGDTISIVNGQVSKLLQRTAEMAGDVQVTSGYGKEVTEMNRQCKVMGIQFKRNPTDSLVKYRKPYFLDSIWSIKEPGFTAKKVVFSFNAQGTFRYKVDTFTVRQAVFMGSVLRLENYLNTGKTLDLFAFKNGRWYNQTQSIQLFPKGLGATNTASRGIEVVATYDPSTSLPTPQKYILEPIDIGTYQWDGKTLKLLKKTK